MRIRHMNRRGKSKSSTGIYVLGVKGKETDSYNMYDEPCPYDKGPSIAPSHYPARIDAAFLSYVHRSLPPNDS